MIETKQQASIPSEVEGTAWPSGDGIPRLVFFLPLVFIFFIFFQTNVRHRTSHSTLAFHGLGREDLLGHSTSMEFNGMDGWVLGGWQTGHSGGTGLLDGRATVR